MTTPAVSNENVDMQCQRAASRDAFAAWSQVYDRQANPLLSLEERFLSELLPPVAGLDVVDIGCGTGRWLLLLALRGPGSLTGVDSSPSMVDRARIKLGVCATVLVGDAASLPLRNSCADLVVSSFVASYVADLPRLPAEIRRIVRPGAQVFLSDLHPGTASECKWKRSFRFAGAEVELVSHAHSVAEVIECFEAFGFEPRALLEPAFGATERDILQSEGKVEVFRAAANRPAIYLLQFHAPQRHSQSYPAFRTTHSLIELSGSRVAIGPDESIHGNVEIIDGTIGSLGCSRLSASSARSSVTTSVDLSGYLVLPGLTNSHDHLEFGLFPNLGCGPYINFEQWAEDIHRTEKTEIDRQCRVPKDIRLWWGGIRNLLCGVTTVCHHNPIWPELLENEFPVRVVTELGWAHSLSLDPDLSAKFAATSKDQPFVLHAAEGVDAESSKEVFRLDQIGALDERSVLVHGLSLGSKGLALVNRRGAALVWCPSSNHFLFDRTHDWQSLSTVKRVVLGSDSPLTSTGNLLDEVRYACREAHVPPDELYRMVVTRPPEVFRLTDGRGGIRPGAAADLIAVPDIVGSPSDILVNLSCEQIELVVIGGKVQLASQALMKRLPKELYSGLHPLDVNGKIRWIRASLGRLCGVATQVLGCDITLGGIKVRHVNPGWI